MYVPYKNMKNQPNNPQAVDKVDAHDVQADVLATDVSENSKIPSLKQLKTETKVPTKAINAINEQLGNAQASASDAVQRVVALEDIIRTGNFGSQQNNVISADMEALMSALCKDVKSWQELTKNGETVDMSEEFAIPGGEDINDYLPNKAVNVRFNNSPMESEVNIFWDDKNVDSENGGQFEVTAKFERGYFAKNAPTCIINVSKVHKIQHVMGMVLVNSSTTQWVRINENYEEIDFDPLNNVWAGMKKVTTEYGDFIEIPTTWVKTETLADGPYKGKTCYWVADQRTKDFHVHPAFKNSLGQIGNLRIAAYLTSKADGKYISQYKSNSVSASSFEDDNYSVINSFHPDGGYRAYNIYDHHFIARLMLVEFGTPDVRSQIVNGVDWSETSNRKIYHEIYDLFGFAGKSCVLDGIKYNKNRKELYIINYGGARTTVTVPYSMNIGVLYMNSCITSVHENIDFSDLFIMGSTTSTKPGNFADWQCFHTSGDTLSEAMQIICGNPSYGIFYLGNERAAGKYSYFLWRMAQVVTN